MYVFLSRFCRFVRLLVFRFALPIYPSLRLLPRISCAKVHERLRVASAVSSPSSIHGSRTGEVATAFVVSFVMYFYFFQVNVGFAVFKKQFSVRLLYYAVLISAYFTNY